MSTVRSKNTKLERNLFDVLINLGLSDFSTHVKELPGKPDVVFSQERIVVFLDSCFWHGCPKHLRMPATNIEYWQNKIKKNKTRDKRQSAELKKQGWCVVRIWEHELKQPVSVIKKISSVLKKAKESGK